MDFLSKDALDELRQFDTPTISNGIEFFELGARNKGFMNPSIKSALAIDVPMVGYAVTLKCSAMSPPQPDQLSLLEKHYENLLNTPDSVTVVQDIDPSPIGSFWGEVKPAVSTDSEPQPALPRGVGASEAPQVLAIKPVKTTPKRTCTTRDIFKPLL